MRIPRYLSSTISLPCAIQHYLVLSWLLFSPTPLSITPWQCYLLVHCHTLQHYSHYTSCWFQYPCRWFSSALISVPWIFSSNDLVHLISAIYSYGKQTVTEINLGPPSEFQASHSLTFYLYSSFLVVPRLLTISFLLFIFYLSSYDNMFFDFLRERERWEALIGYHKCSYQGSNPQRRHVRWPGIKHSTFWCMGQCSNQLSHPARTLTNFWSH